MKEGIEFPVLRREAGDQQWMGSIVDAYEFIVPGTRNDAKIKELKECCQRLADAWGKPISLINAGAEILTFPPEKPS